MCIRDRAIATFRKLKSKPEYKENATFFLIQSEFLQGNMNGTISEGQDFISSYPGSKNIGEVYRLLGSSYYRLGNIQNAIHNYEQYRATTSTPCLLYTSHKYNMLHSLPSLRFFGLRQYWLFLFAKHI